MYHGYHGPLFFWGLVIHSLESGRIMAMIGPFCWDSRGTWHIWLLWMTQRKSTKCPPWSLGRGGEIIARRALLKAASKLQPMTER